jgi:hypothetical protein
MSASSSTQASSNAAVDKNDDSYEPTDFITAFFLDAVNDSQDRSFADIIRFNNQQLEYHHDYIQLLFPLPEPSPINPGAPIINSDVRAAFLKHPELRLRLVMALERMLHFYGFALNPNYQRDALLDLKELPEATYPDSDDEEDGYVVDPVGAMVVIVEGLNFARRRQSWMTTMDHNHLRLTRIIRCLRVLGLDILGKALYAALLTANFKHEGKVSARSKKYWKRAAERPLWLPPSENDESADGVIWLKRELEGEEKSGEDTKVGADRT